jgi:hypothetical protein
MLPGKGASKLCNAKLCDAATPPNTQLSSTSCTSGGGGHCTRELRVSSYTLEIKACEGSAGPTRHVHAYLVPPAQQGGAHRQQQGHMRRGIRAACAMVGAAAAAAETQAALPQVCTCVSGAVSVAQHIGRSQTLQLPHRLATPWKPNSSTNPRQRGTHVSTAQQRMQGHALPCRNSFKPFVARHKGLQHTAHCWRCNSLQDMRLLHGQRKPANLPDTHTQRQTEQHSVHRHTQTHTCARNYQNTIPLPRDSGTW